MMIVKHFKLWRNHNDDDDDDDDDVTWIVG